MFTVINVQGEVHVPFLATKLDAFARAVALAEQDTENPYFIVEVLDRVISNITTEVTPVMDERGLDAIPPEIQATRFFRAYMQGVISAEECNAKLKSEGFAVGVKIDYNDQGEDIVTGFKKRI